ncbi:MAG: hypothetical protein R2850_05790 [Bacteroidia bacterium]
MIKKKTAMLSAIPAIQPVNNKDLKRMASGFGYRTDPIYKTTKFHAGMDFSALLELKFMQQVTVWLYVPMRTPQDMETMCGFSMVTDT